MQPFKDKFNCFTQKDYAKYIPFIVLFFIMLFVHRYIAMYSDDSWFYKESNKQSYWEYILFRFNNWTGRLSAETMAFFILKFQLVLWKIVNPIMISAFSYLLSRILIGRNGILDKKNTFYFNCLCCILIGYINVSVISSSMFWATGSIYYLWTVVAGLAALIPYIDSITGNYKFNIFKYTGFIICAAIAACSQEQTSFALLSISIVLLVYDFFKNRKIQISLLFETLLIMISCIILFIAPGNGLRYKAEVERWFPGFDNFSLIHHLVLGIQWLLSYIINQGKIIIMLIWILVGMNFYEKFKESRQRFLAYIPLAGVILLSMSLVSFGNLLQISGSVNIDNILRSYLFEFREINFQAINLAVLLPYIIWGSLLLITPIMIFMLYDKSVGGVFSVFLLGAAFCTSCMMFFSPTIYASGYRVFFVMSVLLIVFLGMLILKNTWILRLRNIILLSAFPAFQLSIILLMWIKESRTFI